jgi:hypothetical protein
LNKKNIYIFGMVFLIIAALVFYGFYVRDSYSEDPASAISENCNRYNISVIFNPDEKIINGVQQVSVINNSSDEWKELYFHLYPNAFKTLDSCPFPKEEIEAAYPKGFLPGFIDIEKIETKNGLLKFEINDTILKVQLQKPLKPGQQVQISMEFKDLLPPSLGRFGYGQYSFNIANWYPILAVYDENGWNKDPYYPIGDPFYSDVAIYEVKIKAPKQYEIASTGSVEEKKEDGTWCNWTFKTGLVRDFAWIASDTFKTCTDKVGKTTITSYYLPKDAASGKKALDFAKNAISFFNEYFGVYPYSNYSVAASDFYIGGMEFPNLVIIGEQLYGQQDILEYVVAHETAHQWWYGIVGNNEIKEPWLDESLTEFSTVLYFEHVYGKKTGDTFYEDYILNPYRFYELGHTSGHILRPLSEFSDWGEYDAVIYSRGAIVLRELERRVGKAKFREALRVYFQQNMYKNASTQDFIEALNRVTGTDWTDYILNQLNSSEPLKDAA